MYENLKNVLDEKGISMYRLAKLSNIASPDLYSALSGKKVLFPNWKKRISEALDVPEEELFEEGR